MARNLMIFGPKNSQRRELFCEKKSNERDERKVVEKFEKYFEIFLKIFSKIFRPSISTKNNRYFDKVSRGSGPCLRRKRLFKVSKNVENSHLVVVL